jgi:molecular chaperone GrpE
MHESDTGGDTAATEGERSAAPTHGHAVPEPATPAPDAVDTVDTAGVDVDAVDDDVDAAGDDVDAAGMPEEIAEEEVIAEIAQFEADLATLQRERDEWLDTTRRLQADFENYRKRVVREQTALVERASEGLLEQLLPVLDNFELALQSIGAEQEQVRKGVELVYADLIGVLERNGLERIAAEGAPFDPNEHEAVMQDDGEGEPVVGGVMRTGWKLKGRVLRPAMVKVIRS